MRTRTGSARGDYRIAVVGGGAVGVTAAVDLATRGASVTLFDRRTLGSGSSGRAAGVLYDAYAGSVDAAVAARSMERFRKLSGSLRGFDFHPCPYVIAVREGDDDAPAVSAMVERMRANGRDVSVVDPTDLSDRYPIATDDLSTAVVADGAGWTDPASYVDGMGERARVEGVRIETNVDVELGRVTDNDERPALLIDDTVRTFDAVIVAVGAHTRQFFADGGVQLPVHPYRVQALVSSVQYDGPMVYDATAGAYYRSHPAGLLAGDGTIPEPVDPDGYDREADDWFLEETAAVLRKRAEYDPVVERAWAGLCTATPDGDPLVGEITDTVFVAAGWQGHGFMRAPGFGELLAEGVLSSLAGVAPDEPESPLIDAFDPNRFDGDESFEIREGMSVRRR